MVVVSIPMRVALFIVLFSAGGAFNVSCSTLETDLLLSFHNRNEDLKNVYLCDLGGQLKWFLGGFCTIPEFQ
jgi:hypothetical protein